MLLWTLDIPKVWSLSKLALITLIDFFYFLDLLDRQLLNAAEMLEWYDLIPTDLLPTDFTEALDAERRVFALWQRG